MRLETQCKTCSSPVRRRSEVASAVRLQRVAKMVKQAAVQRCEARGVGVSHVERPCCDKQRLCSPW